MILALSPSLATFARYPVPKLDPKKGEWGYVDETDKWIIKPKFQSATEFTTLPNGNIAAKVSDKEHTGYINLNGKGIGHGVSFESIDSISPTTALVKVKGKYGICDWDFQYILKPDFTDVQRYYNTVILYKGEKCGVASIGGDVILPTDYNKITPLDSHYYQILRGDKTGILDVDNRQIVVGTRYENAGLPFILNNVTLFPVNDKNGKKGIVDSSDNLAVPLLFDRISYYEGLDYLLATNPETALIYFPNEKVNLSASDIKTTIHNGLYQIEGTVRNPNTVDQNSSSVYKKYFPTSKFSIFSTSENKLIIGEPLTDIKTIGNIIALRTENKPSYDLYTEKGEKIASGITGEGKMRHQWIFFENKAVSPENKVFDFTTTEDNLTVIEDSEAGKTPARRLFLDGQLSKECYDSFRIAFNDYYWGIRNGKGALIKKGEEKYPCELDPTLSNIYDSNDNLIALVLSKENKKGVLDTDLKEKIPFIYDDIIQTRDAFKVKSNGKWGILSPNGTTTLPVEYDEIHTSIISYLVKKENKWGLTDIEGNTLVTPQFDDLYFNDTLDGYPLLWTNIGDKYGVINEEGKTIVPCSYLSNQLSFNTSGEYFEGKSGKSRRLFTTYGEEIPVKREIIVTDQYLEHNIYHNGVKCLKVHFSFKSNFIDNDNEEIYVLLKIYKKNGEPARDRFGKLLEFGSWYKPGGLTFALFNDKWVTFPNSNFLKTLYKQEYYVKIIFQDESGRTIPTQGNGKLGFNIG